MAASIWSSMAAAVPARAPPPSISPSPIGASSRAARLRRRKSPSASNLRDAFVGRASACGGADPLVLGSPLGTTPPSACWVLQEPDSSSEERVRGDPRGPGGPPHRFRPPYIRQLHAAGGARDTGVRESSS